MSIIPGMLLSVSMFLPALPITAPPKPVISAYKIREIHQSGEDPVLNEVCTLYIGWLCLICGKQIPRHSVKLCNKSDSLALNLLITYLASQILDPVYSISCRHSSSEFHTGVSARSSYGSGGGLHRRK